MTSTNVTRRGFLKATAAVGAALAATSAPLLNEAPAAFADEPVERVIHKTACHGCTNAARSRVHRGRRVVKIEGDPGRPPEQGRHVPEVPVADSDASTARATCCTP